MGSVINRGSRSKPNWYIKFKDVDGRWKARPSKQPTKEQAKAYLREVEARGALGIPELQASPLCQPLMEEWLASLTNRNAQDDRSRCRRELLPTFGATRLSDVTLPAVMKWLDAQQAEGRLSAGSIRHNLNLLSRFFAWAIDRERTTVNPVRQIPFGKRPKQPSRSDAPWLDDDDIVRAIIARLPEPVTYMFYLGNRSGLRTGEIAGLRLSDFDFLDEGVIRVRFSYDGPLKEDKHGEGKVKFVPAAEDCAAYLGPWLERRRANGAGPEDLVFPGPTRPDRPCRKEYIESRWEPVAEELELELTWYQATRHSFVSRSLKAGASLDEVSAAVGHSSPVVTKRWYDHLVRRSFSAKLRGGLGLGDQAPDNVVALREKSGSEFVPGIGPQRAIDPIDLHRQSPNQRKIDLRRGVNGRAGRWDIGDPCLRRRGCRIGGLHRSRSRAPDLFPTARLQIPRRLHHDNLCSGRRRFTRYPERACARRRPRDGRPVGLLAIGH